MVISMNGKIRAYVSRGLEVLSEGNGVADTTEETKDTKGKGSAQKVPLQAKQRTPFTLNQILTSHERMD